MGCSEHRRGIASRLPFAALTLTVALSLSGGSALAQNATFARADYQFLGHPVIVDLNGDGRADLASTAATSAAVMLGNGDGTFGPRREFPVDLQTQDIVAGDFNNDSRVDLILTINNPATGLSLLFGNGDGTFGAPVNLPNSSGFDSPAIVATDLDGDAWLDLVIGHGAACYTAPCRIATSITVMLGNGDGTFQPPIEVVVGSSTSEIAVGDFNRDGLKDIALASSSSRVHILIGAGDGTFSSQTTLTMTADTFAVEATDVDVGDFNRDGIQDLVVAVSTNGSRTAILLGRGDGTFAAPHIITEPNLRIPQYQAVADYNRDGFEDLAISLGDGTLGLMEILNGRGDGTFGAPVYYLTPPDRSSISGGPIATGDFNGDGKPDLALPVTGAFPAFAALTNTTGSAPPPAPAAPTLLSPANDSRPSQPVTFDWTDVTGAAAYQLQVDDSSSFSTPRVIDRIVTPSTFTSTGIPLQVGLRHFWRVRGVNSAGVAGAWSSTRRFTPQGTASTGPTLSSVVLNPTTVTGGSGVQGTATISAAAPSGGAVVTLTSSNGVATVPSSVTIAAGATSTTFPVTTTQVTATTFVTITGAYGGVSRSVTLTVNAPPAPASLNGVSVNPTSVVGGSSSTGIVGLTAVAPAGGFTVALSSSSAAASVPASVTIPAGSPSATFNVATSAVAASTAVTITATAGGVTRTTTLTVTPAQQTSTATLTVSASGRSGERVISSPAGISVAVGSTGSATFNTGTSITLSVSNGRDAIWSGACSSGGNKTRTCTLTLNANASVSANVQ